MAITPSALLTEISGTDSSEYTTSLFSPTSNSLVLATIYSRVNTGTSGIPTLTGNSLTWVSEETITPSNRRLTTFRALGGCSSGTLVISFSGQTQTACGWSISEYAGADTSGTNGSGAIVQSASSSGTSDTSLVVLSSFSSSLNYGYGGHGHDANNAVTPGAGWTEVGDAGTETSRIQSQYLVNGTSVTCTHTSQNWLQIGIEIKEASVSTMIKTINNLAKASIKTINDLAIASVKSVNDLE